MVRSVAPVLLGGTDRGPTGEHVQGRQGPGRRPGAWLRAVMALASALALLLVVAGCSGGDDGDDGSPPTTAERGRRSADEGAGDRPAGEDVGDQGGIDGPYPVGLLALDLVDTSRPTRAAPGLPGGAPDRALPVDVLYPATGEAPGATTIQTPDDTAETTGGTAGDAVTPIEGAEPAPGRFPLVELAHGTDATKEDMRRLAAVLARAGYVVAVPTFPLSRAGVGEAGDYVNQPADMSFVLDQVLARGSEGATGPLSGHVDGDHVAVAGHALGAATVYGLSYNSCCLDERVDATIGISGGGLLFPGGDYEGAPATPLLVVLGARDATVPTYVGDNSFATAQPPAYYLLLEGADHTSLLDAGTDGDADLLVAAAVAFLDAQLKAAPAGLDAIGERIEAGGGGEWRSKA